MTLSRKTSIALVLLAASAVIFVVFALTVLPMLVFRAAGPPSVIRSDRPLSLAEVKIRFPFPPTATNIQYAEYQEFIAYEFVVRFEAPKEDCLATVPKAVEAYHSSLMAPDNVAKLSQIQPITAERDHVKDVGGFSVPWFDPENIKSGVEAGKRSSHTPRIWIDTARGMFYFQYTD